MAVALAIALPCEAADEAWISAMQELHAGFQGTEGYVAQYGDSITYSMVFWSPFSWSDPDPYIPDDTLPKRPAGSRWRDVIKGADESGKGPEAGNYSGWTVDDLLRALPDALARQKPEIAVIMIGSNDVRGNTLSNGYGDKLEQVIRLVLDAKCIPLLSTIPPMRGAPDSVARANQIILSTSIRHKLPLIEYHAAIVERAPAGRWDGTLIGSDGIHPTVEGVPEYSEENLARSGYSVRNLVTFLKYREVYFKVLHPELRQP